MVIEYAAAPKTKPLLEQAKQIRQQAEALEVEARDALAEKRGRGRPNSGKETVTLRLDSAIVAYYKTYGDDWRVAMEDALRKGAHL